MFFIDKIILILYFYLMQMKKVKHIFILLLLFDAITIFISTVFKQKTILYRAFSSKSKINTKNTGTTVKIYTKKPDKAENNFCFNETVRNKQYFFDFTEEIPYLINNTNVGKVAYALAQVTMLPHHSFW